MGADRPSDLGAAAEQLHAAASVNELLGRTAESFVKVLDAPACTISRIISAGGRGGPTGSVTGT
jgi:hypothetical protein